MYISCYLFICLSVYGLFVKNNLEYFSVVTSAKRVSVRRQIRGNEDTSAFAEPDTRGGFAKPKVSFCGQIYIYIYINTNKNTNICKNWIRGKVLRYQK